MRLKDAILTILSVLALYALLKRLFVQKKEILTAAWVALVFAAHPLATEVTCLVSNVSDHIAFICLAGQLIVYFDVLSGRRTAR